MSRTGWRAIRTHRAIAGVMVVLVAGAIPSAMWQLWPARDEPAARATRPDPRYASQLGSRTAARRANIAERSADSVEAAVETCAGIGLVPLATKYGIRPDEVLVARRFASSYEAAYRRVAFGGCLEGLRHGG